MWRLAKSLEVLRAQINEQWPDRNRASDGTIGDAAHQAVPSDHNPNAEGVVCALDITNSPKTGFDAHALADRLLANRHPDLKYIISNDRIAGAWTNWQWQRYDGSDPHDTHIHISVGVGPDGQSQPPYDDVIKWDIGGDDLSDIADHEFVADACVLGMNLQPETNQVFLNNIGLPKSQVIKNILNYSESRNLRLRAEAYDGLQKRIKELNAKADANYKPYDGPTLYTKES